MVKTITVTSVNNPKIKDTVLLRSKRSYRDERSIFLLEGAREINRALKAGVGIDEIFTCDELLSSEAEKTLENLNNRIDLIKVSTKVFSKLVMREKSDGLLAIAKQSFFSISELKLENPAFIVYLHSLEKPGNLGGIFRSADGAGVQAIFLSPKLNDPYNPNAVRSSIGTVCSVPKIRMEFSGFVDFCKKQKIILVASSPQAKQTIFDYDFRNPVALILGSEQNGLEPQDLKIADKLVQIPMTGVSDSLNVSVSAGIMFYEILRQRLYLPEPQ